MNEALCEEFMRQHTGRPQWEVIFLGFRLVMEGSPRDDEEGREIIEMYCGNCLKYWIQVKKGESGLQVALAKMMGVDTDPFYFVTVNYSKDFTDFEAMKKVVSALEALKWIKEIECVHEYHGTDSNHPHTHMLIIGRKKMPPSEVIDKVYAVKGLAKLIGGKNFVHLAKNRDKTISDYRAYIQGAKTDTKLENVAKDIEWRQKNNLI